MITSTDATFRGEVKVATLHDRKRGKDLDEVMPPLSPLWAPVPEVLFPQGMLLLGHDRVEERGEVREYRQGWWARLP